MPKKHKLQGFYYAFSCKSSSLRNTFIPEGNGLPEGKDEQKAVGYKNPRKPSVSC